MEKNTESKQLEITLSVEDQRAKIMSKLKALENRSSKEDIEELKKAFNDLDKDFSDKREALSESAELTRTMQAKARFFDVPIGNMNNQEDSTKRQESTTCKICVIS
jgi:hypothetical protein